MDLTIKLEAENVLDYNTSEFDRMSWFKAFRNGYDYTSYGDNRTAAFVDIPLAAVIYASVLVSVATLIATIGIRGKERWSTFIRVAYSLFVGASILVSIFGHGWQSGKVRTTSYYTFVSKDKFDGEIGLKMGLDGVNITLMGHFGRHNSDVYYNERMLWFDVGQIQADYQGCLSKGLPEPILSTASYFSYDEGGLRWGRGYRDAGYFTYVLLWTSFSFWLVTNVLLTSVVFYGSAMFLLSGVAIDLAVVVYHVLQPRHQMRIPFEDGVLSIHYDWSYWLMVATGSLTTILGLLLLLLDWKIPKKLALFFLLDSNLELEEDDSNHNLARSPNGNNNAPTKRSYLSLIDQEMNKNSIGYNRVDRQTSTINGEINRGFLSQEDIRPSVIIPRFHSQGCLTDGSPLGSRTYLMKSFQDSSPNTSVSEDTFSQYSVESLPFEPQELKQFTVNIPEEELANHNYVAHDTSTEHKHVAVNTPREHNTVTIETSSEPNHVTVDSTEQNLVTVCSSTAPKQTTVDIPEEPSPQIRHEAESDTRL